MPQGDTDKNDELLMQKWPLSSPKVKYAMALYQKIYVTRSTIYKEIS